MTISVSNMAMTTTLDAGGNSLQVRRPGIYSVTASGGGLPSPITRTVVVRNQNMRLNFDENPNGCNPIRGVEWLRERPAQLVRPDAVRRHGLQLQRHGSTGMMATLHPRL